MIKSYFLIFDRIYICIYICIYACIYVCIYMPVYICMCMRSGSRRLFRPRAGQNFGRGWLSAIRVWRSFSPSVHFSSLNALLPLSPLLLLLRSFLSFLRAATGARALSWCSHTLIRRRRSLYLRRIFATGALSQLFALFSLLLALMLIL